MKKLSQMTIDGQRGPGVTEGIPDDQSGGLGSTPKGPHLKITKAQQESKIRWRNKTRRKALVRIMEYYGEYEPRCMAETLPDGHPLKAHECYGQLQIDHIYGGGGYEYRQKNHPVLRIADGRRDVSDLRVLCQLHQLWNQDPTVKTKWVT